MNVKRTLATVALATLALLGTATAAQADSVPVSKADANASKSANASCSFLGDDYAFEACWLGYVQMQRTTYRADGVTVKRARTFVPGTYDVAQWADPQEGTHAVGNRVHKASKADKRALKRAFARCMDADDLRTKRSSAWDACTRGMFTLMTGRVITDTDYVATGKRGHVHLRMVHGSHRVY